MKRLLILSFMVCSLIGRAQEFDYLKIADQWLVLDNISTVQSTTATVGQRIKVLSNDLQYRVQQNEVPGFVTDEQLVITLGSNNFAVLEVGPEINASVVSPVGNGIINDTEPILRLVNFANALSVPINLNGGKYLVDKTIDLDVSMYNGTIIAQPGGTYTQGIVTIIGDGFTKIGDVSNNVEEGDRWVDFDDSIQVETGDILVIRDTVRNSWFVGSNPNDPNDLGYQKGEFLKVQELSTTGINIMGVIMDSYTASDSKIYRLDYTEAAVHDLEIIGDGQTHGIPCLHVEYGARSNFYNLKLSNSRYGGARLNFCTEQSWTSVIAEKRIPDLFPGNTVYDGLSYGINVGSSQDLTFSSCRLHGVRHGITFGGGNENLVNRFIKVVDSDITGQLNYAASFHPNTEYCSYDNCDIRGGVRVRGINNTVQNSRIFNLKEESVFSNITCVDLSSATLSISHRFMNNTFVLYKVPEEGGTVLFHTEKIADSAYRRDGILEFIGNKIQIFQNGTPLSGNAHFFVLNFVEDRTDSKVIFKNNVIESDYPGNTFLFRQLTAGLNAPRFYYVGNSSNLINDYILTNVSTDRVIASEEKDNFHFKTETLFSGNLRATGGFDIGTGTANRLSADRVYLGASNGYFPYISGNSSSVLIRNSNNQWAGLVSNSVEFYDAVGSNLNNKYPAFRWKVGNVNTEAVGINSPAVNQMDFITGTSVRLKVANNSITLPDYGSGIREAGDIAETPSIYRTAFSTSGALVEVAMVSGTHSETTDGFGDIEVTHGLGAVPTKVLITGKGTTGYAYSWHTEDATTFAVRVFDLTTGAAVTGTSVDISYQIE